MGRLNLILLGRVGDGQKEGRRGNKIPAENGRINLRGHGGWKVMGIGNKEPFSGDYSRAKAWRVWHI